MEGLGGTSLQGDMAFVDVLEYMGCTVAREPGRTTVTGGPLRAVDVDMNAMSDTVMTLGVVALFADGVSRIRNVAHIRHKESDRIAALAAELRKLGADVDELPDGLVIDPPPADRLRGAAIATYDDHRMAMSFAVAGLRIPGVTILDPGCVAKTYPGFWDDLRSPPHARESLKSCKEAGSHYFAAGRVLIMCGLGRSASRACSSSRAGGHAASRPGSSQDDGGVFHAEPSRVPDQGRRRFRGHGHGHRRHRHRRRAARRDLQGRRRGQEDHRHREGHRQGDRDQDHGRDRADREEAAMRRSTSRSWRSA